MNRFLLTALAAVLSLSAATANAAQGRELVATAEINSFNACNSALEVHQGMLNTVQGDKNTFVLTDGYLDGRYLMLASGTNGVVPITQTVMVVPDSEGQCSSSGVTMGVFDTNCEAVIRQTNPEGTRHDLEGIPTFHVAGKFIATTYLPAGQKCVVITSGSVQTPKASSGISP